MNKLPTLGIIAPSSVVPKVELELGVNKLRNEGFTVLVHPQVNLEELFYAGTDQDRANAFLDFAFHKEIDVLWCARGGYGATSLLPILKKETAKKKPAKKILFGYSDATALLEFTRAQWGWKTVHSPMPSLKTFSDLKPDEWTALLNVLRSLKSKYSYMLEPIYLPKGTKNISAPIVGGNFAVWNTLIGTPYAGNARNKILFFEDLQENVARLNRMIHHLEQSGGFKGAKAILLGEFLDCRDTVPQVFKIVPRDVHHPMPGELKPLRESIDPIVSLHTIFKMLGERTGIPIFGGLPMGHGEGQAPLVLGEKHVINVKQNLLQY